jgi:hypothetical protein
MVPSRTVAVVQVSGKDCSGQKPQASPDPALGARALAWLAETHRRPEHGLIEAMLRAPIATAATKAVCDLSLLVWCRAREHARPLEEPYRSLGATLLHIVESPEYVTAVLAHPRQVQLYGRTYAAAKALGHDCTRAREAIAEIVESGVPWCVERAPYQQLELVHFLRTIDLAPPNFVVRAIAATTLFTRHPNPARLSPADAYALAHDVFYLTDFGCRPLNLPQATSNAAPDLVRALLTRFLADPDPDPDLITELTIALVCLRPADNRWACHTLRFLGSLQRQDGTIARDHAVRPLAVGSTPYALRTWWFQHYHTVVVAVLLTLLAGN